MFKFIIKLSLILVILFENLYAQIHLNKTNLATVCKCDPTKSLQVLYLYSSKLAPKQYYKNENSMYLQ